MLHRQKIAVGMLGLLMVFCAKMSLGGTAYNLEIPKVTSDTITIDGILDEGVWSDPVGTLHFGPGGIAEGYDNEDSYNAGGQTQYDDQPTQIIKFRHDGAGKLYMSMKAYDKDIQSLPGLPEDGWWYKCDSDGIGNFVILQKGTTDQYAGVTLTFYPTAATASETVITSQAGTVHANDARGTTWDWSFLPGNNTVNTIDDVDTGYIIECVVDLTLYGYSPEDTDIQVGLKNADHDGPQSDYWPWNNSYAHVFQWSSGNYSADYGIDHLMLSETMAREPNELNQVKQWSLY